MKTPVTAKRRIMTQEIRQVIDDGYFVGVLDGAKSNNIKSFLINIAIAFRFPDYYGENIKYLLECINDLDWLNETNYALIINNSDLFMSGDTVENKTHIINLLEGFERMVKCAKLYRRRRF